MNNIKAIAILVSACFLSSVAAFAQAGAAAKPASEPPTIASVLDRQLSGIERNIMGAAEAISADKYDFSPATANIPGDFKTPSPVRTMGEQFKHIGDALELYGSAILGEKRPATPDENGPKNVKTKDDVINYLKASFAKGHSAIKMINQQNVVEEIPAPFGNSKTTRLSLAVGMVGHSNNHYGQIIEYLRMNGMVPPESQPRK
ncbi:MAG TPA: DinB family protein [Terriglobales bacterium]|nr:DinB family protein [Terriglobales bacterium]